MARKEGPKLTADTEVKTTEAASISGLSVRSIQLAIQDGKLKTIRDGVTTLGLLHEWASARPPTKEDEEVAKLVKARNAADLQLKAAKAAKAKMEVDELKGLMHRAEDVAAMTEDLIYEIRGALIALPGRLAVDVAAATTPAEASEIIRKEVHKVMRELANYQYDPKKYEERERERMDWSDGDSDDE